MSLRMLARLDLLMEPLRISSAICSAGSLLLEFISLSTPYWVLQSTKKGLVHSGLWTICIGPDCTMYWFNLLVIHIHFTRAFMVIACFCSFFSLLCVCISFERDLLFNISVLRAAVTFSLVAALLILLGMAIFTYVQRHSQPYTNYSLAFGSSYALGWASVPMHLITENGGVKSRREDLSLTCLCSEEDLGLPNM
nr:lens fiber membrane intrinsic protein-like [Zootoca vivipara]